MVSLRLDAPRVLLLCGACFMTAVWGALPSYSRTFPSPSRQEVVVDSLFNAGAYDSVLVLTSSLIEKARASADSVLLGRMLTVRGCTEVITRKSASGMESIDASIHISIAAGDTTNWMAALGFNLCENAVAGSDFDPFRDLLGYGVPPEWLGDVRQATEDSVLDLADLDLVDLPSQGVRNHHNALLKTDVTRDLVGIDGISILLNGHASTYLLLEGNPACGSVHLSCNVHFLDLLTGTREEYGQRVH